MATLLDHIDRFSYTAQAIQSAAKATYEPLPSPYVCAVLRTPLGDLARDVDASEIGLFTLVPNATAPSTAGDDAGASATQKGSVARVEFPGATPLRRPAGALKHARRENDKEPEVYAEAALKYLDRYQSIRPMPRARQEVAAIIGRLNSIRGEITQLTENADQDVKMTPATAPTLQDEEKRIHELNLRIKQMKARKDVLLKKRSPGNKPSPVKARDRDEDAFWSEPATAHKKARTGRKSLLIPTLARGTIGPEDSMLLDTHMKVDIGDMLGDVSMNSIANVAPTPLPPSRGVPATEKKTQIDPALVPLPSTAPSPSPVINEMEIEDIADDSVADGSADLTVDEGDTTIMITKPPTPPPRILTSPAVPLTPSRAPETSGRVVGVTPGLGIDATPGTARVGRIKVTTDVERIVAKIWSTVADIIMPGHPFNTAAAASTNKPPRAKETIVLLQNLSKQTPPSSPTTSHSTLSLVTDPTTPSVHAILTAHLLLALINTVPRHAMPLAATKAVLAEANKSLGRVTPVDPTEASLGLLGGGDKAMETRALYGCIAKRLLKIDRSGREQLVKFDI